VSTRPRCFARNCFRCPEEVTSRMGTGSKSQRAGSIDTATKRQGISDAKKKAYTHDRHMKAVHNNASLFEDSPRLTEHEENMLAVKQKREAKVAKGSAFRERMQNLYEEPNLEDANRHHPPPQPSRQGTTLQSASFTRIGKQAVLQVHRRHQASEDQIRVQLAAMMRSRAPMQGASQMAAGGTSLTTDAPADTMTLPAEDACAPADDPDALCAPQLDSAADIRAQCSRGLRLSIEPTEGSGGCPEDATTAARPDGTHMGSEVVFLY
jgi:hypothetical protein